MAVTLDKIVARVRTRVAEASRSADRAELELRARQHKVRGFRRALEQASARGVAVIAELKRASPSRGVIRGAFPVGGLAQQLAQAGAAALSVLTEEEFFHGLLVYLDEASIASDLPCLRKDFIVDEFQLLEARAHGADAVLLIVAALSPAELPTLARRARSLDLDVLCEVHDQAELGRALDAGCGLIGVNSRDLRTFQVDVETALRLGPQIPPGVFRVAESGIRGADDIHRLRAAGYQAFLIGESLMQADSPGAALKQLLAESAAASPGLSPKLRSAC
ncbi:MAG: indole-3-glycerol phosphate synthase TrpC [Acidobacteria bacterium]|nr:indole-3-glycerol phosphate synthase TrpC [Acidobacteriota bacterium]